MIAGADHIICPFLLEQARLIKDRPAQAVTSHCPISKSWLGPRKSTGTMARAAGSAKAGAVVTGVRDDGERAPPGGSAEAGHDERCLASR